MSFWNELKTPIFALAPLADVTDAAFRRLIAKYSKWGGRDWGDVQKEITSSPDGAHCTGGPDVMFTEFTSADGLALADERGREMLLKNLEYSEAERPIVAQLFGAVPEHMEHAAALAAQLGFDGIDINMGCPHTSIENQGAGAALIKTPERACEIIDAARAGAASAGRQIPVSVKTRIGYSRRDELEPWLTTLLKMKLPALTVHLRTRREMSDADAHWEMMPTIVALRDTHAPETLVLGNGDVWSLSDAQEKIVASGCDGAMLGRAIFGNPWLFANLQEQKDSMHYHSQEISVEERLRAMVEHTKLFHELLGDVKPLAIMKKHYKAYTHGFDGAKELRIALMGAKNADEIAQITEAFLQAM